MHEHLPELRHPINQVGTPHSTQYDASFGTDRQVSGSLLTATDRLLNGGNGRFLPIGMRPLFVSPRAKSDQTDREAPKEMPGSPGLSTCY